MNSILSGKTALVTGASRGLGRAMALALGKAGADVAVTDLLVEDEAVDRESLADYGEVTQHFAGTDNVRTKSTAAEIQKMGPRALGLKMDVTKPEEINQVVGQVENTLGKIDILVNNAGLIGNFAWLEKQTTARWELDLEVNLSGAFHCAQAVWPGMRQRKWGRIINISSVAALLGALAQPGYGATKAGLIGLTSSLALEGASLGITVNAVLPGFIDTEAIRLMENPGVKARLLERVAMKRFGRPEEVAALVVFLASDWSSYITGAAIPVTGGADLLTF
ncbi:MAG: SDR family oxidoreductase [Pseudomonadota bacterium]